MHFKQIVGCLCALSLVGCVNKQKNVDHHVDVITSIKINGSNTRAIDRISTSHIYKTPVIRGF